jgi:hypothetical protein
MPAPTTTGGGLMGYPSTVDAGGVPPSIISNDTSAYVGAVTKTETINTVNLWAFEIYATTVILGGSWYMGATVGGTSNMGIYTIGGAIVPGSDSGAITNLVSQLNSFTYATPVVLSPGQYLMGIASSNGTDTYLGTGAAVVTKNLRARRATNVLAAGALPLTTGTLVNNANSIACSLIIQGGLP